MAKDEWTASDLDKIMVEKPPHYNQDGIECITAIKAATGEGFDSYLLGNIIKYVWRHKYKGKPKEDLEKAALYLKRLIEWQD